ncbi:MAG TPA: T9SS type A sorting domain-containing protein [Ignavibacteria bacterium]|nr:T9SS type A sorting domain-containing protein [Ignavibacteria bacterium]HQY52077.1 T9SS type A sorting domain-containing protein [Ignavibacteria bacterium]HRA99991.1 T9SS type A sorting domain-containing protein [Ignavibacteria bacterium]
MKKIFGILILFCLAAGWGQVKSQSISWERLYDNQNLNDNGVDICEADSGNFYVVGYSTQSGPNGVLIYIMKIKPNGDTIWEKTLQNHSGKQPFTCASTGDGGCIITGSFSNIFFIKVNNRGDIIWEKNFNEAGVILYEINKTMDGGYIACGRILQSTRNGYLIKIDSEGNIVWKKILSGKFSIEFYSVTEENNYYVAAGYKSDSEISPIDGYLIKLNSSGEIIREREFYFNGVFTSFKKIIFHMNNYIIAGSTSDSSNSLSQTILIKTDTSGKIVFSNIINYYSNEYLQDFKISNNNKFVFTSDVDSTTGRNARIYLTDSFGNIIKQRIIYLSDYTLLRSIQTDRNSRDIIFLGTSKNDVTVNRDIFIVRTDSLLFSQPLSINNNSISFDINGYVISQNYPNPFNSSTQIKFILAKPSTLRINVNDILGKIVYEKKYSNIVTGSNEFLFNSDKVGSGYYFCNFFINGILMKTILMILVK